MKTKAVLAIFVIFRFLFSGLAGDAIPEKPARDGWQALVYPQIGLKLQLPTWKADIEDQNRMWSLLAYPLVKNPAADVQYRVVISIDKYTEDQYLRLIRNPGTNSSDWSNSEHLQTSVMTNAFWIYSRRDVWRTNGFSYRCVGRIKRDANLKPKPVEHLDGEEEKLAVEVLQILDSIEVVHTSTLTHPLHDALQW